MLNKLTFEKTFLLKQTVEETIKHPYLTRLINPFFLVRFNFTGLKLSFSIDILNLLYKTQNHQKF